MTGEFDRTQDPSQTDSAKEVRATLAALASTLKAASDALDMPVAELCERVQKLENPECNGVPDLGMQLEALCAYEIARSERYGRCLSLLMVGSGNGPVDIRAALEPAIRMSDAAFNAGQSLAIVMGDTDVPGIERAVDRFKRCCQGSLDLRYGAACYPSDHQNAGGLVSKVQARLGWAKTAGPGAVVCKG